MCFFLFFFFQNNQSSRPLTAPPLPPTTLPCKRQMKTGGTITPKEITKHSTISQPLTKQKKFYWNVPLPGREVQKQESMELKGTGEVGEQGVHGKPGGSFGLKLRCHSAFSFARGTDPQKRA